MRNKNSVSSETELPAVQFSRISVEFMDLEADRTINSEWDMADRLHIRAYLS